MNALSLGDALDAAAYAWVGARCRHAHLHDIRGELQTLQSSLELLARSARNAGENIALAEKATALARRALASHEKSLVDYVNRMTPHEEAAVPIEVRDMVNRALGILRNDAANKSITFKVESGAELRIRAQPYRAELLILGLLAMTIDELSAGSVVKVLIQARDSHVVLEIQSDLICPAIRAPEDLWCGAIPVSPLELLLGVTSRWAAANGGRVEASVDSRASGVLRIYYPRSWSDR